MPAGRDQRHRNTLAWLRLVVGHHAFELSPVGAQHHREFGARRDAPRDVQRRIGDLGRAPVNRLDVKLLHPAHGHSVGRRRHSAKCEGAVLLHRSVIIAAARRVQRELHLGRLDRRLARDAHLAAKLCRRQRPQFDPVDIRTTHLDRQACRMTLAVQHITANQK